MPHKPFNIYKRPTTKKNINIFYVQFYDDDGNRLPGRSSGQTSRAAAETRAHEQLKKGLISPMKDVTFGKYAEQWWVYDKCPYIQGKLARGFDILTCPPKTSPNVMLGSGRKIFRRRQVNGPKKVHTGTDYPKTPQKLKCLLPRV